MLQICSHNLKRENAKAYFTEKHLIFCVLLNFSSNILLTAHFEARISDLGLAQQATGGEVTGKLTHVTKKNTSIQDYENKAYYAPEIARGNGFSIKGDTYAFGVVGEISYFSKETERG